MEKGRATSMMPRMLIADDDPAIVRMIADYCTKAGFDVEVAGQGLQALIMANRNHPEVLVIDVNMPGLDGLSVCVRLCDPAKRSLDMVVVTGSRDPETVERCESIGVFYARKGPDFWKNLAEALIEIFPAMVDQIRELPLNLATGEVRKRPCVLVVDDDPTIEVFLTSRLAKYGIETLYASDGLQGYRLACKKEPSVIISDFFMPNGDALYLLSKLRTNRGTENIPVFVFSGRQLDDLTKQSLTREICGHPGAAQFFRKTFDTDELFAALQKFCAFDMSRAG